MRLVVWDRTGRPDLTERISVRLGDAYDVALSPDDEDLADALGGARALVVVTDAAVAGLSSEMRRKGPLPAVVLVTVGGDAPAQDPLPAAVSDTVDAGDTDVALLRVVIAATIKDALHRCWRAVMQLPDLDEKLRVGIGLVLSLDHPPTRTLQGMAKNVGCEPRTLSRAWHEAGISPHSRGAFLRAVALLRVLLLWLEDSNRSWTEIGDSVGVTPRTVGNWVKEWFAGPPSALRAEAIPSVLARMEGEAFGWLLEGRGGAEEGT